MVGTSNLRSCGCSLKGYMGKFCHCCCGSIVAVDMASPVLRLLAHDFQTGLEPADSDGSGVSRLR